MDENRKNNFSRQFQNCLINKWRYICSVYYEDARRIGKPTGTKNRPVVIVLVSEHTARKILSIVKELKNTGISLKQDYTQRVTEEKKELQLHFVQSRESGYKAYMKNDKKVISGETCSAKNLEEEESSDTIQNVETEQH